MITVAQSLPLLPLSTSQEASGPQRSRTLHIHWLADLEPPLTDPQTLQGEGSPCSYYNLSWGETGAGTREAQQLRPQPGAPYSSHGKAFLTSVVSKLLFNPAFFQLRIQWSSFLQTLYIQCNPVQDRSNTEFHLTFPSAPSIPAGPSYCLPIPSFVLPPQAIHSTENTFISPPSEELLPSEIISYVMPLPCLHPLAYEHHKESLTILLPVLFPLPCTDQKAVNKF